MASSDDDELESTIAKKKIKISRRYCPHCKETLSYKTFRTHKRLYYDAVQSVWHEDTPRRCSGVQSPSYSSYSPPPLSPLLNASTNVLSVDNDDSPPCLHHDDIGHFTTECSSSSDGSSGTSLP